MSSLVIASILSQKEIYIFFLNTLLSLSLGLLTREERRGEERACLLSPLTKREEGGEARKRGWGKRRFCQFSPFPSLPLSLFPSPLREGEEDISRFLPSFFRDGLLRPQTVFLALSRDKNLLLRTLFKSTVRNSSSWL